MRFLLKEYGSWSVMLVSFFAGILIRRTITYSSILSLLSLCLYINSKQAFTIWIRQKDRRAFYLFSGQILLATILILTAFSSDSLKIMPFVSIPIIYLIFLRFFGEHSLITELVGFSVLTLSSLIARFSVTGAIDLSLYIATALFFMAGVLKVRIQLKKRMSNRIAMVFYIFIAMAIYYLIDMPLIILLPLIDNLIFSLTLYRVRLATTGWIEVAKSLSFLMLIYLMR